ncbi:ABC transporter, permease protein [Chitinispirillum alkaliphilum]|nr:ABC transporter, permease protein [Chitinispirillum alkaliphilum]
MKIYNLFIAELTRFFVEIKRYYFETLSGLIVFYLIFISMFYGIRSFGGADFGTDRLDVLIAGYIMWTVAVMGFQVVSNSIYEETQRGTLEQIFLCSLGVEMPLILSTVIHTFFAVMISTLMLFLTMLTTGRWLYIDPTGILGVLALSLPSLWGIGLIIGSLTIVYKKIASLLQIFIFLLIAIVAVNAYPLNLFTFLPFASGATTIRLIMTQQVNFSVSWYLTIFVINYAYLFAGIVVFKMIEKSARRKNLLSQY